MPALILHAEADPAVVARGRDQEDLYFRLHVLEIHLAPLRERREDILPLAREFLRRLVRDEGRDLAGWSAEVEAWLLAHDWPGNVRELQNAIERGAVLAEGDLIELCDLAPSASASGEPSAPVSLAGHLDRAQREHIRRVLTVLGGKRHSAAEILGIDRTTLYRLMRKHGLS